MTTEPGKEPNQPAGKPTSDEGVEAPALRRLYDSIYESNEGNTENHPVSTANLAKARSRVRQVLNGFGLTSISNKRVLDLGSGLGFTSEAFRELGANVTGIDLSPIAVKRATDKFTGIDFRCVAFPDGLAERQYFDIIWTVDLPLVGLFETINIESDFLKPCMRLLKPDGCLIVGWHTNFTGKHTEGWVNWSLQSMRQLRKTFRSSPALIPQARFFWSSALVCKACQIAGRSAPVFFLVRAANWQPVD